MINHHKGFLACAVVLFKHHPSGTLSVLGW